MKRFLTALVVFAAAVPASAQNRVRIRIYMAPPAVVEGFVDETTKGQRDTFADLREQLAKKKTLALVESPDQADVTLTIRDRDRFKDTGETTTSTLRAPTGLLSSTSKDTTKSVTVALTAGDYSKDLTASNDAAFGAWKYIAGKLAGQIEKWAADNAETIVARRQK